MKNLREYISEVEQVTNDPQIGDSASIELSFSELVETYIVDITEDGVVLHGDDTVLSLLKESGYTLETIQRYGAAGNGPGQGYTLGEQDKPVTSMSDLDIMRQDYYDMSPQQFYSAHRITKQNFIEKYKSLIEPTADNQVARIMELSGLAMPENANSNDPLLAKSIDDAAVGALEEAEYQGRNVPLGKPMAGDVKKSKVYVKGPKGNVVKVNFGDKTMRIKKSNPDRRKSFRARHNCENPGPRWKARYWSCRAW